MKLFFLILIYIKLIFHNKGFALSLVLKARVFGTRKWPIRAKGVSEKYSPHFG